MVWGVVWCNPNHWNQRFPQTAGEGNNEPFLGTPNDLLILGCQTLQSTQHYYDKCAKWQQLVIVNIWKAPERCSWLKKSMWSRAAEIMSDGLVWFGWLFPFRLFPRVWLCKDVRIAFVWNVGHGAIAFVTVLLHFRVTKRLILKLPKIQVMPHRWNVFTAPALALLSPALWK